MHEGEVCNVHQCSRILGAVRDWTKSIFIGKSLKIYSKSKLLVSHLQLRRCKLFNCSGCSVPGNQQEYIFGSL